MSEKPNNERPADLAVQDSVGGMAKRLLNPAHQHFFQPICQGFK